MSKEVKKPKESPGSGLIGTSITNSLHLMSKNKSADKHNMSKSTFYTTDDNYDMPDSTSGAPGYDCPSNGTVKKSSPRYDTSPDRSMDYAVENFARTSDATPSSSSYHRPLASVSLNHSPNSNMLSNVKLEMGDRVFVVLRDKRYDGVVRWLEPEPPFHLTLRENSKNGPVAGLEMDVEDPCFSDGIFKGENKFECPANKRLMILAKFCQPLYQDFGDERCPVVPGDIPPISSESDIDALYGVHRGIQGHYNSCYLDATLFSMFAFNSGFDSLLYRPRNDSDIPEYKKVQEILKDKIVNPLRRNKYVRADRLMELRELLEKLGSVSGLTCEEKDPEEFLVLLLQQILKEKPFLQLSSSQESYYYQLFVEKNEKVSLPTVQYLLELSFLSSNVKLKEVPATLVVLMPRFGKSFKVYPRIVPTPQLEVTDIIENSPRICSFCGMKPAATECIECFLYKSTNPQNRLCAFCQECDETMHKPPSDCSGHKRTTLTLPSDFEAVKEYSQVPPIYMDLFAVVCIETSHYVSFVKCGVDPGSPWCFFDSMADRVGEQNGYNIPVVEKCRDLDKWLSDDSYVDLKNFFDGADQKNPPPSYVKRLLTDVYLCMYRHRDVSKYK